VEPAPTPSSGSRGFLLKKRLFGAYAQPAEEAAIKTATQEKTLELLTSDGLDVQVLVYDINTSLPPEESPS
jgi:hypothetical protein